MMVSFIAAHRDAYGVEPICAQLPMAPSTYFEANMREVDPHRVPARTQRDTALCPEIDRVWRANRRVYGVQKVWCHRSSEIPHRAIVSNSPPPTAGVGRWMADWSG